MPHLDKHWMKKQELVCSDNYNCLNMMQHIAIASNKI